MGTVTCPSCGASFDELANRYRTSLLAEVRAKIPAPHHQAPEREIDEAASVTCPQCGAVFVGNYRFFGFLSPRGMKITLGTFLLVCIAFIGYALSSGI